MTRPMPFFSRFCLGLVLTMCALAMILTLTVMGLQMFRVAVPAVLLTVMHVQTVALPVGSASLLGYAAIRERRTQDRTPSQD